MATILIVEDEEPIANLIKMSLLREGHLCQCVYDGLKACDLLENNSYDLILLDIMLPNVDGFEVMAYAKTVGISVIFLTAMDATANKVRGLRMGAEDYMTKPFEIAELIARVDNVLRRGSERKDIYKIHKITVDFNKKLIRSGEEKLTLTVLEFELLVYLINNIDQILSREQIYEHVWQGQFDPESRTVDMSIQRLKKKLQWDKEISSVYKVGYRLMSSV